MQQAEQIAQQLCDIPKVQIYRLVDQTKSLVCEGNLKIGFIQQQDLYYLNVADYFYNLGHHIPMIMVSFATHKAYYFPHLEAGFCAAVVGLSDQLEIQKLETIFANTTQLMGQEGALQNDVLKQCIDQHWKPIFSTPLVEDSKAIYYIEKGGNMLKMGFGWLGTKIAQGVNKGGEFIQSKMGEGKKVEVSPQSKLKFAGIKEGARNTMNYTGQVIGNVLNPIFLPVVQKTNEFVDNTSKSIDEGDNQTLKTIKRYGQATGSAISNAFSGLVQGSKQVGNAIGSNTRNIVEKKYGDDVTNTYMGEKQPNNNNNIPYQEMPQNQPPVFQPQPQPQQIPNQGVMLGQQNANPNLYPQLQPPNQPGNNNPNSSDNLI